MVRSNVDLPQPDEPLSSSVLAGLDRKIGGVEKRRAFGSRHVDIGEAQGDSGRPMPSLAFVRGRFLGEPCLRFEP